MKFTYPTTWDQKLIPVFLMPMYFVGVPLILVYGSHPPFTNDQVPMAILSFVMYLLMGALMVGYSGQGWFESVVLTEDGLVYTTFYAKKISIPYSEITSMEESNDGFGNLRIKAGKRVQSVGHRLVGFREFLIEIGRRYEAEGGKLSKGFVSLAERAPKDTKQPKSTNPKFIIGFFAVWLTLAIVFIVSSHLRPRSQFNRTQMRLTSPKRMRAR